MKNSEGKTNKFYMVNSNKKYVVFNPKNKINIINIDNGEIFYIDKIIFNKLSFNDILIWDSSIGYYTIKTKHIEIYNLK